MKVIDLLNRIANGEEVPKKIRIYGWCYDFEWIEYKDNYYDKSEDIDLMSALSMCSDELNRKVEIIEEEKKITPTDFENLGYALGSIQKYINKGYDKAIEENNKIEPLKIEQDTPSSNFYIRNEYGTKCGLTKHSKMIAEKVNELVREINKMKKD